MKKQTNQQRGARVIVPASDNRKSIEAAQSRQSVSQQSHHSTIFQTQIDRAMFTPKASRAPKQNRVSQVAPIKKWSDTKKDHIVEEPRELSNGTQKPEKKIPSPIQKFDEVEQKTVQQFQNFIYGLVGPQDQWKRVDRDSQTAQEFKRPPGTRLRTKRLKQHQTVKNMLGHGQVGKSNELQLPSAQRRIDSEREGHMNELLQFHVQDVQEIITKDQEKIDYLNKLNMQTVVDSPARSPGRRSVIVSPLRKLKRRPTTILQSSVNDMLDPSFAQRNRNDESDSFIRNQSLANEYLKQTSQKDYQKVLKSFQKHQAFSELYGQRNNVYMSMIESSLANNTLPKKLQIIQDTNLITTVNARSTINMLPSTKVFSSGILSPQCRSVKSINVSHNGLNMIDMNPFLKSMPPSIEELNLMGNRLELAQMPKLVDFLRKSSIKVLNLERNSFGDQGCIMLVNSLIENRQLRSLNLSKNQLSALSCESLGQLLKKNSYLSELYLHYNNINQQGGSHLFKGLLKNSTIKVLDVSHNSLGNTSNFAQQAGSLRQVFLTSKQKNQVQLTECCQALVKMIEKTIDIVHLDVSHNQFTRIETQEIARALRANQSIYGFHYEGNDSDYVVDTNGLLRLIKEPKLETPTIIESLKLKSQTVQIGDEDEQGGEGVRKKCQALLQGMNDDIAEIKQHHRFRRIQGVTKNDQGWHYRNQRFLDTCWICEGWQEVKFHWKPGKSGDLRTMPVFLHVDIANYQPLLMNQVKDEFMLHMVLPPDTKIHYFFTNPVLGIQTVAKEQLVHELESEDYIDHELLHFLYNGEILVEGQQQRQVNYLFTTNTETVVSSEKHYVPTIFTKPREDRPKFDFSPFLIKAEMKWRIETSIFNNFQADNAALIDECFEFDFNSSKISRLVKETETDQVKETLRTFYPHLFSSYKLYASSGSLANLPCLTMNAFNDFIGQTQIMDGRIRSTDIDVNFISSNGKDLKYPQVYERALVRYQYLEILVRIAMDKYYKSGICRSINSAISRLFHDDGLLTYLAEIDSAQLWRDERFWNEECDTILRQRLPFLKVLFKYTCRINPKTKFYKHLWASAKDFRDMLNQAQVIVEIFGERDCYLAFLLSMMTQVDELFASRHYQMNFYEFIEGLARAAEKVALTVPKGPNGTNVGDYQTRRELPLHEKLEGFILYLYFRLGENIKREFMNQADDDILDMDSAVLGLKKAKLKQQQVMQITQTSGIVARAKPPPILTNKKSVFLKDQKQTPRNISVSSSSSSSLDSDDSLLNLKDNNDMDMGLQEYILCGQLKPNISVSTAVQGSVQQIPLPAVVVMPNQKVASNKRLNAVVRGIMKKQEKLTQSFSLISVVSFLRKKASEKMAQEIQQYGTRLPVREEVFIPQRITKRSSISPSSSSSSSMSP